MSWSIAICLSLSWGIATAHSQTSRAPQPTASPQGNALYLTERVAVTTNSGVIGYSPGTRVSIVSTKGEMFRVSDGERTFDVPKAKLTGDAGQARMVAQKDYAAQQAAADYLRRINATYEQQRQLTEQRVRGVEQQWKSEAQRQQNDERQRAANSQQLAKEEPQIQGIEERQLQLLQGIDPDAPVRYPNPQQRAWMWKEYLRLQMSRPGLPEEERETINQRVIEQAQQEREQMLQAQRQEEEMRQARRQQEEVEQARRQQEEMEKEMYRSRARAEVAEVEARAASARSNPVRSGERESYESRAWNDIRRADDPGLQSRLDEALRKMDSERQQQEERQRREDDDRRQRELDNQFSHPY